MNDSLVLYHAPQTRSTGARLLLEELGDTGVEVRVLNMKAGEQRGATYLAINPMGKVPALTHGDAVVTEQVAVLLYLADLFPAAGLAPALDDRLRGPYLRWMAFYGASFEPAVVDRFRKHEPGLQAMSPYGDFDSVMRLVTGQLATGPWLLGDRFTAADVLWGMALGWTIGFGLVPASPVLSDYVSRVMTRPAALRVTAADKALVEARDKAANA
jgi:glutathione S-transferase